MSVDLAPSVRKVLQRVKAQLHKDQCVERAAKLASMQQLQAWCDRHELVTTPWFTAKTVSFDSTIIDRIEQTLHELGLAGLTVAFANQYPSPIDWVARSPSRGNTHRNWLAPLTRAFRSVLNLWFCIRQHHCRFEQNGPAD